MQNIVLIGAGFIGGAHAAACSNSKLLNMTAICDSNEKVGKELADKYGCAFYTDAEKMLQECEVDIVNICVPTFLHKQFILLAAKYKKHIVCEKPIVLSMEDMDEILEAVNAAGVKFMVAQVLRFWPEYVAIKEMYDNGDFGDVQMVYANRLAQHPIGLIGTRIQKTVAAVCLIYTYTTSMLYAISSVRLSACMP